MEQLVETTKLASKVHVPATDIQLLSAIGRDLCLIMGVAHANRCVLSARKATGALFSWHIQLAYAVWQRMCNTRHCWQLVTEVATAIF
jgi:hypothetical protein